MNIIATLSQFCYGCDMRPEVTALKKVLKEHGSSLTSARLKVFEALTGHEPQSMAELIRQVDEKVNPAVSNDSRVNRASVYRTIALFEQLAIVHRLNTGWKYKLELTGRFMHHHHHLTCVSCGNIFPLPEDSRMEQYIHDLATSQHFLPSDHQLEIRGLCRVCQKV